MSEQQWVITVDRDRCIGSGVCAGLAAEHFATDHVHHRSQVLNKNIVAEDAVLDAAMSCPMEAIGITKADTGEIVFPTDTDD
jgi:ferredoxin